MTPQGVGLGGIYRTKRPARGWAEISQTVFNASLTAEAMGVLCYLLSKPDDWIVQQAHLCTKFTMGRERLRRIIAELVNARFVIVHAQQRASGKRLNQWAPNRYEVFDEPQAPPLGPGPLP